MICTLTELRSKDVINIINGENLGRIDDIELDAETSSVTALILYGRPHIFGLFGSRDNCVIRFHEIRLIGQDVILVSMGKTNDCSDCINLRKNKAHIL